MRAQVPIPVCTMSLAPARQGSGRAVRPIEPDQWVELLVPAFGATKGLPQAGQDCAGYAAFANESLRGGVSTKGWPRSVEPEEVELRAGPDATRIVWLRVLNFENGDEGGPIALARVMPDRVDVYGIGSFRGPVGAQLSMARIGNEHLLVAETKICGEANDCAKRVHFYLVRRGRLVHSAAVDLERTAIVPSVTEQGLLARYTLRTDLTYKADGIQLLEQVRVRIIKSSDPDRDGDRDLRKVEFSRTLRVERDALFSSNDPLWDRVVGQD